MSAERLFRIIGMVEDDLIEAAASPPTKKHPVWQRYAAMAACLCMVCLGGLAYLITGGFHGFGTSAPGSGAAAGVADGGTGIIHESESIGAEDAIRFMSYAGPVLPLTAEKAAEGVTAERHTDWNFAPTSYQNGGTRQWGAVVTDRYALTNTADEDVTLPLLYPIAADLSDIGEEMAPELTVNGETVEWGLAVGDYAGSFRDAGVEDGSTWNLSYPDSWADYQALLADGSYRAAALRSASAVLDTDLLEQRVSVYTFTDFEAPHEHYDAATQAITFPVDTHRTTVLTYGFNGYSWDMDTSMVTYDYFVPNGIRHDGQVKQLIVLGDDIENYVLQGYANGACEQAIDGVSCTLTRRETTLGEALLELCESYLTEIRADPGYYAWLAGATDILEPENYCALVVRLLTEYGVLSDSPVDRYNNGRMDEVLPEVLTMDRVLYLTAEVVIPAGETVEVSARYWKFPSFDYGGSGSEFVGLQGFDLVTVLDSPFAFTAQTASLSHAEGITLAGQSFGFDLESGITEVTLDVKKPHYYLEARPIEAE